MGEKRICLSIFHKTEQGALCKTMKRSFAINFLHLMLDFLDYRNLDKSVDNRNCLCYILVVV